MRSAILPWYSVVVLIILYNVHRYYIAVFCTLCTTIHYSLYRYSVFSRHSCTPDSESLVISFYFLVDTRLYCGKYLIGHSSINSYFVLLRRSEKLKSDYSYCWSYISYISVSVIIMYQSKLKNSQFIYNTIQ